MGIYFLIVQQYELSYTCLDALTYPHSSRRLRYNFSQMCSLKHICMMVTEFYRKIFVFPTQFICSRPEHANFRRAGCPSGLDFVFDGCRLELPLRQSSATDTASTTGILTSDSHFTDQGNFCIAIINRAAAFWRNSKKGNVNSKIIFVAFFFLLHIAVHSILFS